MRRAQGLGHHVLADGTQLIGRAKHIGSEAWLHLLFAPISDADVDSLESSVGIRFPEVFRDFLTLANGLSLFSNSLSIYGQRLSYDRTGEKVWQPFSILTPNTFERLPDAKSTHLFIGGYPSGRGYYLYIDIDELRVYRCSRQSSKPLHKWGSFSEMLVCETTRLAGLFDEQGCKLNSNMSIVLDEDI